jgi:hypothetical protein
MRYILLILFICWITSVQSQQIKLNVPYVDHGGNQQQMDLYLPAKSKFRTILFLHGGSLLEGDKNDYPLDTIGRNFQRDGICFVTANYRLGPGNKWPSQPDDVCSAFRWLKMNLADYGGDTSKIYIMGHSSGALLTAIVSTDEKYLRKQGLKLNSIAGFIPIGTQVKAVLPVVSEGKLRTLFEKNSYLSIFGDKETYSDVSPISHINRDMPKVLFIIAETEQYNPPILEQTREFIEKGSKYNLEMKHIVTKDRTHFTNITKMAFSGDEVYRMVKDFIEK